MNSRIPLLTVVLSIGCATPTSGPDQPASQTPRSEPAAQTAQADADGVPSEVPALTEDPVLNGKVWWYDATAGECQAWNFVRFDGYVALERRTVEEGDGWSLESAGGEI